MAGPVDVRLVRRVGAARTFIVLSAVLQAATVGTIIVQALVIASLTADLVTGGQVAPGRLGNDLLLLAAVALVRAGLAWVQERYALRSAGRVIGELRESVLLAAVARGPRWRGPMLSATGDKEDAAPRDPAETTIAVTQGLDALEPYLVHFLPALILAGLATPAVLAVIATLDPVTLAICLITLPLVPVFMWLIGQMTAGTAERRLAVVSRLGAQVLDLITGLPTLRAFGREIGPGARVRALGEQSRVATMGTLRVAFLSAMVLELLTTLSVALVAVSVGLRLVDGAMTLRAGLAVIMLAPEVYAPLRHVAAQFHASTNGLAAADAAFAVIDVSPQADPDPALPDVASAETALPATPPQPSSNPPPITAVELTHVSVRAPDRGLVAPADLTARIPLTSPAGGQIIALTGPTGAGKSTTAQLILGLLAPDVGEVRLETSDGRQFSPAEYGLEAWWQQLVWLPQRPYRDPATAHLSVGQRHRVALAAALEAAPDRQLLLLDEPTAHLDGVTEETVLAALCAWRDSGRTAIVIAHRPSVIAIADQVIEVDARELEPCLV